MERYVTVEEMKAIDRDAIEGRGIPAIHLMENAGKAVALESLKLSPRAPVAVFCGYGNNGGDGLVSARLLIEAGIPVKVLLVGKTKKFSAESAENLARLTALGCEPIRVETLSDLDKISGCVKNSDLIIDAIFGIGVRGRLEDFYKHLIDFINLAGKKVISVDIPSGMDADSGKPIPVAVKASVTVTMGYPKVGFRSPEAKDFLGLLVVADIGL
ncbi:MAG TPA: NAD(P)H-hydrate epimerase [Candidatus Omnitrophota bacterium]|nr:NAD(P)H-hydrate epimerase [Candidatus Omnitrophota bacterium]